MKNGFQDQLSLNAGQKYCRMLQGEHSAILSTFINQPHVIKTFALSILSGRFTQVLLSTCDHYKFTMSSPILLYNVSICLGYPPEYKGLRDHNIFGYLE